MGGVIWFTKTPMRLISLHFPLSHGVPCVDDRRAENGIVFVLKSGLHRATRLRSTVRGFRHCVRFRPNTPVRALQAAAALRWSDADTDPGLVGGGLED